MTGFKIEAMAAVARFQEQRDIETKVLDNPLQEFETTLKSYGLDPTALEVTGYGKFKRLPSIVGGKRSKDSGWYWLEQDGETMYGCFGDWRTGDNEYWQSQNVKRLSPDERAELDKRIAKAKELHTLKLQQTRDEAAAKAVELLTGLKNAKANYGYFKKKQAVCHEGVKTDGKHIYIPITIGGAIRSYQKIDEKGGKTFCYEAETKGGYFWIKGTTSTDIYFTTGYATGDTVHEATGANVMVCFNDSNMYEVMRTFRANRPDDHVYVVADNDHHNDNKESGNSGLKWGNKCVDDHGNATLFYPEGIEGTDFNDMKVELGIEQVRNVLSSYTPKIGMSLEGDLEITETDWLIDNYIPKSNLCMAYGASGSMKTFMILDWGLHIASGIAWHDNDVVESGSVVYVCGEGFSTVTKRIKAWKQAHNVDDNLPFLVTHRSVAFLETEQLNHFVNDLTYTMVKEGMKEYPAMIIVDTLNRNFGGAGDENSTKDMTAFVAAMDELNRRTGSTIMIVHHTGKGEARQARGSSALRASLDAEFSIEMINSEEFQAGLESAKIELQCTKMKDAEPSKTMVFQSHKVQLKGKVDRKGNPISNIVLLPCEDTRREDDLASLINMPYSAAANDSELAKLFALNAFIKVLTGMAKQSEQPLGMIALVQRNDFNAQFRAICKKEDKHNDSFRKFKQRALEKLSDIGAIDKFDEIQDFYAIRNKTILEEVNKRATQ